jgi:hypothetical protein
MQRFATIVLLAGLAGTGLAGCMTAMSAEQQAALQAQVNQCRPNNKTAFDKASCVNKLEQQAYGNSGLMQIKYAKRLQLAVAIDQGKMTEREAQAEFTATLAQLQLQD